MVFKILFQNNENTNGKTLRLNSSCATHISAMTFLYCYCIKCRVIYFSCYRIEHLSLNMAMQLLVGVPLEMVHGALRIGLVYVCGVLAGRCVASLSLCYPGTKTQTDMAGFSLSAPSLFHLLVLCI